VLEARREVVRHLQLGKLPEHLGAAAHHAVVLRAGGALVEVHLHLHPLFPRKRVVPKGGVSRQEPLAARHRSSTHRVWPVQSAARVRRRVVEPRCTRKPQRSSPAMSVAQTHRASFRHIGRP
jgi:hypothetical protein